MPEYDEKARAYHEKHRSPLHVFPIVTGDLQKQYEQTSAQSGTPDICGYHGRACRQMEKEEGANRALCTSCKLAEFCHVAEMEAYAKD